MTDTVDRETRSRIMKSVRRQNTKPEMLVRKALHAAGFRFRLHRMELPGSPDIYLPQYRCAVFVHGCFWHGHSCRKGRAPSSNKEYWDPKIKANKARDARKEALLREQGIDAFVIWECSIGEGTAQLLEFLQAVRLRRQSSSDSK